MSKIPTTEELMLKYIPNGIQNIKGSGDGKPQYNAEKLIIQKCMIEFARLHVQQALQAASGQVEFDKEVLIRQSILQAYPLNLVK